MMAIGRSAVFSVVVDILVPRILDQLLASDELLSWHMPGRRSEGVHQSGKNVDLCATALFALHLGLGTKIATTCLSERSSSDGT